jgi:hypothetical protein
MTSLIEKTQKETGLSIGETMKYLSKKNQSGDFFTTELSSWNQFFNWRFFAPCSLSIHRWNHRKPFPPGHQTKPLKPINTATVPAAQTFRN